MRDLKDKSQITLIVQSLIVIVLFFICEMLFFTYLTKPTFYIIAIICLFLTLGLCTFFKFNLFSFKSLKKKELAIIIISFLILEVSRSLITSFASIPANEEGLNEGVKHSKFFIEIITLGIFIPIIEECIFRGTLIKIMFHKKQWLGVIVSIILFTLSHGPTIVADYIIYGIPAIIYSISYYKTRRLEIPIIIHILNNLLATLY
ncbi:CPBP family intramembrane metalloprotease [Staphylococcus epidermidis]|jgi:membrane protease YdiL (CAAX protease family)|uniref:CPBP family intramembrane glutamic endopeptidase n=1 Tax=Staphylococcus epidermidis TaxID=1282 RepID=UPI000E05DE10|nr:type II CAAX endopeptidase family protein [Staphylococcus epidermidis]MCG1272973.1 CPBP family intramembrane metalloprotease [Staphylococcus epidermidis]SUM61058.1 CAAX amino terminal protease family protein [Staphylococcus epidermidis]